MRKPFLLWTAAFVVPVVILLVGIPLSQQLDQTASERADVLVLGTASLIGGWIVWRATGGSRIARIASVAVYLVVAVPIFVLGAMVFACVMFPRCG